VQKLYTIEHLQKYTNNSNLTSNIIYRYNIVLEALTDIFLLNDDELVVEASFPKELRDIFIKTNDTRYLFVIIAFKVKISLRIKNFGIGYFNSNLFITAHFIIGIKVHNAAISSA
jgi:hypothetical protein